MRKACRATGCEWAVERATATKGESKKPAEPAAVSPAPEARTQAPAVHWRAWVRRCGRWSVHSEHEEHAAACAIVARLLASRAVHPDDVRIVPRERDDP